jgi:hypothetical protein
MRKCPPHAKFGFSAPLAIKRVLSPAIYERKMTTRTTGCKFKVTLTRERSSRDKVLEMIQEVQEMQRPARLGCVEEARWNAKR